MTSIVVIVPTFQRPGKLAHVASNILANSDTQVTVMFVVERDDRDTAAAADNLCDGVSALYEFNSRKRNYAGAVNSAYRLLPEHATHIFLAADDLDFKSGWDTEALRVLEGNRKVAGTNDLHNPYVLQGIHATHYLIDMTYLEDPGGVAGEEPGNVLFEGYDHNFTDTEFIDTAKARGMFAPCLESVVEHLHVDWGLSPWDDTYAKGHANMQADLPIFKSREHLWTDSPDDRRLI